jgi:hypothetical protein
MEVEQIKHLDVQKGNPMRQKRIHQIFSLSLIIFFLVACSSRSKNIPTSAPQFTQTEAPQMTATEPATQAATEPATEAATEAPVTSGGGMPVTGEGFCANAYYPVRQGATWTYKSAGGPGGAYGFTDTITSVQDDGFTLSTQIGNLTRTQEWACKPEGLVALQLGGVPAALLNSQNMQFDLQVRNATGVTLPSEINAGDQWDHSLDFEGHVKVANREGTASGNAKTHFNAIGVESVTVPAGTFDAMKVQADAKLVFNVNYGGLTLPVTFNSSYTYWFAQGVGWVKAAGSGSFAGSAFSENLALQSYNVP